MADKDKEVLSELENAQTILNRMANDFANMRLKGADATAAMGGIKDRLLRVIPKDSYAYPPIDRVSLAPLAVWSHMDGYLSDDSPIVFWHKAVHDAIAAVRPDLLGEGGDRDEHYFSAGERYDALRAVLGIMHRAARKVLVIDPHMDETALDLVRALAPEVQVDLLTTHDKPHFPRFYHLLIAQRGGVEARRGVGFHDRFIVVDERDVWTVGSSLNHFAEKGTSINRLRDDREIEKHLRDASEWWAAATPVPSPTP